MKIFKRLLIVLLAVIVLALVVALFVNKDYEVKREITINKPNQEVFGYVKYLKNQDHFSKWATMDLAMRKTYRGVDGRPGFVSAWDSDSSGVGKGEQEITKIENGKRIDYEIRFMKPISGISPAYITTDSVGSNATRVAWDFKGHMPYPLNLMRVFISMERMIGGDLETGLSNLKTVLEKQ